MTGMIRQYISEAAGIAVLPPLDNNYKSGGGSVAVGACVVVASKGEVGKIITVNADDWEDKLGRPLPMSQGPKAEGLRHLKDALDKLQFCNVVRIVAADARFPSLSLSITKGTAPTKANHAYGTSLSIADAHWLQVFPIDGDPSTERRMTISNIDPTKKRFRLSFEEKLQGEWKAIPAESFIVGVDVNDRDDSGLVAYLPVVLEERSTRFRAEIATTVDFDAVVENLEVIFDGGVNGGNPTVDEWKAAWDLLKTDDIDFNLCFAAGNYEPTAIAHMIKIADGRLAQFRFDVPPWLTETAAADWLASANLESYQASCSHYPYKASDEWYGGKSVWGASGAVTAAKALCLSTPTGHAAVKGAHYTAAGPKRGTINRRGIEALHMTGKLEPEQLVEARINPIAKGKIINDCLNVWYKENYLRFEHTTALLNDLCHEFLQESAIVQFEPDGLTMSTLQELGDNICKKRVEAGAFVDPRNPAKDGKVPYRVTVKQVAIDYMHVEFAYAETGVARRIGIQPRLMA